MFNAHDDIGGICFTSHTLIISHGIVKVYHLCYTKDMNIYAALVLCLMPLIAFFILLCLTRSTPPLIALLSAALALVIVVPVSFVETFALRLVHLNSAMTALMLYVLIVGLVEEVPKALALFALPARHLNDKQFLLCALLFGAGVGCFESVVYFLKTLVKTSNMGAELVYSSIFSRIFTADALHTFCAGLGGLFILSIKREDDKMCDAMAIILAIVLHGLYDYFAMSTNRSWLSIAAIILAAVECTSHYSSRSKSTPLSSPPATP